MTKVVGIGLFIDSELARAPTIFAYFMRNIPSMHPVLFFVCVKYLPMSTIPAEEQFLFCRIGPKEQRMYKFMARYGYGGTRTGNVEFEN